MSNRDQPNGLYEKSAGIGPLGLLPPLAAAGVGIDDFALYAALRQLRLAAAGTGPMLVSWPWNIATTDGLATNAGQLGLVAARLELVPQLVPPGVSITGVAWVSVIAGAYTASNTNGVYCYSLDPTGTTFTRLGVANSPTTWTAGPGVQFTPFVTPVPASSSWRMVWAGGLYNNSAQTQVPTVAGLQAVQVGAKILGLSAPFSLQVALAAQTTDPASFAAAGVSSGFTNRPWFALYHQY